MHASIDSGIKLSPDAPHAGGGGGRTEKAPIKKIPGKSDSPVKGNGSAASATAEEAEQEAVERQDEDVDGFQMPSLDELKDGTRVAKGLKKGRATTAYNLAKELSKVSSVELMKVGLDEQAQASETTKAFIDEVKIADLEKFAKFATEGNAIMEQLNFGQLQEAWWKKLLPGKAKSAVDGFINQHQTLSDALEERDRGYSEEKLQLEEARKRAEAKKQDNEKTYDRLTEKIAALELTYESEKLRVAKFKEENKETADEAVQRRMTEMDKRLSLLARHMNTQVAARTEINNAVATFQEQIDAIDVQIQLINDQQFFNKLVWHNTALMAIIDAKTRGSVEAIKYNRELVEKMLQQRTEDVAQTVAKILAEGENGVVDVTAMQVVTLKNIEMNAARIKGYHDIRSKMGKTKRMMEEMDEELKIAKSMSAAQTEEEIEQVLEHVEKVRERIKQQREELSGKQADA